MLPFIDLRVADYCRIAFNYCLGLYLPIGRSLWFEGEESAKAGKACHLNFDEYVTALLASIFMKEGPDARILTFYAAIPGRFAVSLCSSDRLNFFESSQPITDLPGCVGACRGERGDDLSFLSDPRVRGLPAIQDRDSHGFLEIRRLCG